MKKLILLMLFGIFLISSVIAETSKASTSSNFITGVDSSALNFVDETSDSSYNFIWLGIGIVLFLAIIYILFKKPQKKFKKSSKKKKL